MRRGVILALAILAATSARTFGQSSSQGASSSPASRELFRLEDQWASALIARDSGFFRRTLDADYVYSDERGTFDKDQVIAEQVGGTDTVRYAANTDMRARVHGDAAVVTGILVVRGRGQSGSFQHRYRFTDTWFRKRGRWLMIASQDYDIPSR